MSNHCQQAAITDRRMSEPARGQQAQRVSPPVPPRPRSAQLPELHPNQEVRLDEVGEAEMVENKLKVIPDDMLQYLIQEKIREEGSQCNYRNSPLPHCHSPVCTNAAHSQRHTNSNNYMHNQQHCYSPQLAPNVGPNCDYQPLANYPQCPSRMNQNGTYCGPPNYNAPACPQMTSPQVPMSPSHYPNYEASVAPAPQMMSNVPQRNCNQEYYQGYYCQPGGMGCAAQPNVNRAPCNMARSPGMVQPCQPMSPHCSQQHQPVPNHRPAVHPCAIPPDPCTQPVMDKCNAQQMASPMADHCQRTGPACPSLSNQKMNEPGQNCRKQNECHGQYCPHGCARGNPAENHRYECQWGYGSEHCYHNQENTPEIQCRDISQSQQGSPVKPPQGMRQDSYRRTLEYVQQCRNWSGTQAPESSVTSSTHPMSLPQPLPASNNMIVNDMTSSLNSLLEENRYLQMIQ